MRITCAAILFSMISGTAHGQITVAAAANVKPALEEIRDSFEKSTGTRVQVVYGASGKFAAQIRSGAPFDVFVAADTQFPDSVTAWNLAGGKHVVYARGLVVLWTSVPDLDPAKGPSILRDPRVKRVGVADPKTAPYGREAMRALEAAGVADAVAPKIVWGGNLAQATQFAATGAVDAAFSGKSTALEMLGGKGRWAALDPGLVPPLPQAALVLKFGKENHPIPSQAFVTFLAGPTVQAIWKRHGYLLP